MDPSALESSLKALANAISTSENAISSLRVSSADKTWWLEFWTALVVIGVALEIWIIGREYLHALSEFRRGTIRSPAKPLKLDLLWNLSGAVLVGLGVAGELFVGRSISDIQSELERENGKLVGYLNQSATLRSGAAIERASKADESASKNEKDAAGLKLRATELESQLQPRSLSVKQQEDMAKACLPFAGTPIDVFSFSGDAEGGRLVKQIVAALRAARIPAQVRAGAMVQVNAPPPSGIDISGFNPGLAKAISESLTAAQIYSRVNPKRPDEQAMTVVVGVKPFEMLKSPPRTGATN